MKNIAILLRGHTRNYEKLLDNFNNFKDLEKDYNLFIFIHTWKTTNFNNLIPIDKEKIIKNFNINENNIIIENQLDILNNKLFKTNRNRDKFKFQLYSIFKLKDHLINFENNNNFRFDYVFFTRFDIHYFVKLKDLLENVTNKILFFPKDVYYDIYCLMDRKFLDIYGNMILYNFKSIKKFYNSYGINPIIKYIIKLFNLEVEYKKIGTIMK
jgi:hypothetical protein